MYFLGLSVTENLTLTSTKGVLACRRRSIFIKPKPLSDAGVQKEVNILDTADKVEGAGVSHAAISSQ